MRYVLEGLILAAVVLFLAYLLFRGIKAAVVGIRRGRNKRAPWKVEKDDDPTAGETLVLLTHPDEEPYVIGRVPITLRHWEYEDQLDTLMVEAEAKANSRNRRLA